jgi:uncharacterized membrane protein
MARRKLRKWALIGTAVGTALAVFLSLGFITSSVDAAMAFAALGIMLGMPMTLLASQLDYVAGLPVNVLNVILALSIILNWLLIGTILGWVVERVRERSR